MISLSQARQRLAAHGQEHLLRFYDELDQDGKTRLLRDIESLDLDRIDELVRCHVLGRGQSLCRRRSSPRRSCRPVRPTPPRPSGTRGPAGWGRR